MVFIVRLNYSETTTPTLFVMTGFARLPAHAIGEDRTSLTMIGMFVLSVNVLAFLIADYRIAIKRPPRPQR